MSNFAIISTGSFVIMVGLCIVFFGLLRNIHFPDGNKETYKMGIDQDENGVITGMTLYEGIEFDEPVIFKGKLKLK